MDNETQLSQTDLRILSKTKYPVDVQLKSGEIHEGCRITGTNKVVIMKSYVVASIEDVSSWRPSPLEQDANDGGDQS